MQQLLEPGWTGGGAGPLIADCLFGSPTDYAVVRMHPQTLNVSHYRFPSRGLSYISIPSEAFHGKGKEKMKERSVHRYLKMILL